MKSINKVLLAVAIAWLLVNLFGLGYAIIMREPMHGIVHMVLLAGFAAWAVWLVRSIFRDQKTPREVAPPSVDRIALLESEVSDLQRELQQTKQSLEFTEQLLDKREQ